eukprot:3456169-Rhodomonas_salina.15
MMLSACYAMSGADVAYGDAAVSRLGHGRRTHRQRSRYTVLPAYALPSYALPPYALAMRCPVLIWRMLLPGDPAPFIDTAQIAQYPGTLPA